MSPVEVPNPLNAIGFSDLPNAPNPDEVEEAAAPNPNPTAGLVVVEANAPNPEEAVAAVPTAVLGAASAPNAGAPKAGAPNAEAPNAGLPKALAGENPPGDGLFMVGIAPEGEAPNAVLPKAAGAVDPLGDDCPNAEGASDAAPNAGFPNALGVAGPADDGRPKAGGDDTEAPKALDAVGPPDDCPKAVFVAPDAGAGLPKTLVFVGVCPKAEGV